MLIHPRSEQDHQNIIEQGFTLVELLIVIVILGILAGIVVFAVGNLTSTAGTNSCKTEASTFTTAFNAYKAATGNAPGTVKWTADGKPAGGITAAEVVADLTDTSITQGPFLQKAPTLNTANPPGYYDQANSKSGATADAAGSKTWTFDTVTGTTYDAGC